MASVNGQIARRHGPGRNISHSIFFFGHHAPAGSDQRPGQGHGGGGIAFFFVHHLQNSQSGESAKRQERAGEQEKAAKGEKITQKCKTAIESDSCVWATRKLLGGGMGGHGCPPKEGGGFQKWACCRSLCFVYEQMLPPKALEHKFWPKKVFPPEFPAPRMCSHKDQRDVGIIFSQYMLRLNPPRPQHSR